MQAIISACDPLSSLPISFGLFRFAFNSRDPLPKVLRLQPKLPGHIKAWTHKSLLKLVYGLLHSLDCSASLASLLIAGRVIAGRSVYVEIMPNKHPAMTNKQTPNT